MTQDKTGGNLRDAIDAAEARMAINPSDFRPRLALSILKRCQKEFYSGIAKNKYISVPKGKAFEKSMTLKMPIFNIIETPITDNVLNDKFFVKKDAGNEKDSILQQISNNRGTMTDMYCVATRLQMMHVPENWEKSLSLQTEKKKAKNSKG